MINVEKISEQETKSRESNSGNQIEKNEMGWTCSTYGGKEKCIQDFGGDTCGKATTWVTRA
jgi:hypothetical protein